MQLSDIDFKIGSVNPCGIKDIVYAAYKQDITAWPTIEDDFDEAADVDEYTEYEGNFTLASGKTFFKIYTTQGKGKMSWAYEGETDCKMVVNSMNLSHPKITNKSRALAKAAANGDLVFLGRHDGKWYLIGHPDYRATVTPNGDTGDAPGSQKGLAIEISCPDVTPLPTFAGTIPVTGGTFDCSTNTFTPTPTGGGSGQG